MSCRALAMIPALLLGDRCGSWLKIGPQYVNSFVERAWNVSGDGPTPRYSITFGFSLLYRNFWSSLAR